MSWNVMMAARTPAMLAKKIREEGQRPSGLPPTFAETFACAVEGMTSYAASEGIGVFFMSEGHVDGGEGGGSFKIGYGSLPAE